MSNALVSNNPGILGGKPVIAGTRIAVSSVLDLLASGLTIDEITNEYPGVTRESVQAAVAYASKRMKREAVYPIMRKDGTLVFPEL